MRQFFVDKKLDEQFQKDGFVKIKLLDGEDIEAVQKIYNEVKKPLIHKGLYFNFIHSSEKANIKLQELACGIIEPKINKFFIDAYMYGSSFIVKGFGVNNKVPFHQDWSMCDESEFPVFLTWIPLVDTSTKNGTFVVLPGSHKLNTGIRTLNMLTETFQVESKFMKHTQIIECAAGEAIIYHPALFHGTFANNKLAARITAFTTMIPNETPLYNYHKTGENEISVYKLPEKFHIKYVPKLSDELIDKFEQVKEIQMTLKSHPVKTLRIYF